MNAKDLIQSFKDTTNFYNSNHMRANTERAIKSTCVYFENFTSEKDFYQYHADIRVEEGTTFDVARRLSDQGKVAVLNFANPHVPGGGVQNGAMAQEECLCRSSNLYACLISPHVYEDYYEFHRKECNKFFSDRIIYSEGVTIFKDDAAIPNLLPEEEWKEVDVITCAAPYMAGQIFVKESVLLGIFKCRIKNIFEVALENNVDVLVLGAFGCGAFKNPPNVVAKAFHEVIDENGFDSKFKKIVFAIKSTAKENGVCANTMAFKMEFSKQYNKKEIKFSKNSDRLVGAVLAGRYELLVQLKEGDIYRSYLSLDDKTNKPLIIKICLKENSKIFCDKLIREAYMLKQLAHPVIPKVVDFGETEQYVYAIYEYYTGGRELEEIVNAEGAQSVERVIHWGKQLCEVLDYLHSRQPAYIHRDIRPINIMCLPDETLKIIDFDIMYCHEPNRIQNIECIGAKGYTAPEGFLGATQMDARLDIYSLGATLYRLVTGCDPQEAPHEIYPICEIDPALPKGLEYIIEKCTKNNPKERYQSCGEVLHDLNDYTNLPRPKNFFESLFKKK